MRLDDHRLHIVRSVYSYNRQVHQMAKLEENSQISFCPRGVKKSYRITEKINSGGMMKKMQSMEAASQSTYCPSKSTSACFLGHFHTTESTPPSTCAPSGHTPVKKKSNTNMTSQQNQL